AVRFSRNPLTLLCGGRTAGPVPTTDLVPSGPPPGRSNDFRSLPSAAEVYPMKRLINSAVSLSALLTVGLLFSLHPVVAQISSRRMESIKNRAMTRASSASSEQRTAERFAVLLPGRIVNFADAMKGKRIGPRGECTDLVKAALDDAGAKPGDFTDPKNYIWG